MREFIRKKTPESLKAKHWMLHHDNALTHKSSLVWYFLLKIGKIVIPQPSYLPDLAPADFFMFPKLKSNSKGQRFDTTGIKEIAE
jgi:histone-lysine N-methyltransferase SETMAR